MRTALIIVAVALLASADCAAASTILVPTPFGGFWEYQAPTVGSGMNQGG